MTSDDRVITLLADANPVPSPGPQDLQDRTDAERLLQQVLSAPRERRQRPTILAPALGMLVVVAVVVAFLGAGGANRSAPAGHGLQIILQAEPTGGAAVVTRTAMSRTVNILRERLRSVFPHSQVTLLSANRLVIIVHAAAAPDRPRILALSTTSARLSLYDWEANVLTPGGATVAGQLRGQAAVALTISQGSGATGPGEPGAGGLPLYQAVKLASERPAAPASSDLARLGAQYYLFGAPGSTACRVAARTTGTIPVPGAHCLLAGPGRDTQDLVGSLPPGVTRTQGQLLVIPQGSAVLQAADPHPGDQPPLGDAAARFYVLKDAVALTGRDIIHPRQSTDQGGSPDVTFGFTASGAKAFRKVTAAVARRGTRVSSPGQDLSQHMAFVLDQQLITLPLIDFMAYPDGVPGDAGADIAGGFTIQSARDLAAELRFGALPVELVAVR